MMNTKFGRSLAYPAVHQKTADKLQRNRVKKTFIAERILTHHPDSEKFRELTVDTTV
jgi:hypothetical protein